MSAHLSRPTTLELVQHVREVYGLTHGEALEIMKTPTHPAGLRDEFAGRVLQGAWGCPDTLRAISTGPQGRLMEIASACYDMADAMLKARTG